MSNHWTDIFGLIHLIKDPLVSAMEDIVYVFGNKYSDSPWPGDQEPAAEARLLKYLGSIGFGRTDEVPNLPPSLRKPFPFFLEPGLCEMALECWMPFVEIAAGKHKGALSSSASAVFMLSKVD